MKKLPLGETRICRYERASPINADHRDVLIEERVLQTK
jgi:hypothetical protein